MDLKAAAARGLDVDGGAAVNVLRHRLFVYLRWWGAVLAFRKVWISCPYTKLENRIGMK